MGLGGYPEVSLNLCLARARVAVSNIHSRRKRGSAHWREKWTGQYVRQWTRWWASPYGLAGDCRGPSQVRGPSSRLLLDLRALVARRSRRPGPEAGSGLQPLG